MSQPGLGCEKTSFAQLQSALLMSSQAMLAAGT